MTENYNDCLPKLLKAKEVGKYLGISNNKLYALLKCRTFPSIKIGSRYYINVKSLEEWLERKSHERKDGGELFVSGRRR